MLLQSEPRNTENIHCVKIVKNSRSILKVVRVVLVLRVTLFKSYLQHKSREYLELYLIKAKEFPQKKSNVMQNQI